MVFVHLWKKLLYSSCSRPSCSWDSLLLFSSRKFSQWSDTYCTVILRRQKKKPFTIYYTHNSEGNSVWYVHKVHPSYVGTLRWFGWVPDHSANSLVELFISGEIIGLEPTPQYIHKTCTESQQFQEQRLWGLMTVIPRGTCQTFKMLYTLSKYENIK